MLSRRILFAGASLAIIASLIGCDTSTIPGYSPNRASSNSRQQASLSLSALSSLKTTPVICTALDENQMPTNSTGTVSRSGKVYLHTTWEGLPNSAVTAKTKLTDHDGRIVETSETTFTPKDGRWNTFSWYSFKRTDKVGVWKFTVELNGLPALQKEFLVLDTGSLRRDDTPAPRAADPKPLRPTGEQFGLSPLPGRSSSPAPVPEQVPPAPTPSLRTPLPELPSRPTIPDLPSIPDPVVPAPPAPPALDIPEIGDPI